MLRFFRFFPDTVQALTRAIESVASLLHHILDAVQDYGPVIERVAALERQEALWRAEVEARFIKADSTLKAARAAEERTRGMVKNAGTDEGGEESSDPVAQFLAAVQAHNASGGAGQGVQPMRESVAPRTGKAASRAAKFGVNHG